VIAAAGRASRFHGRQKVLTEVGGRAAICRVAEACERGIGSHRQVVVIGHEEDRVRGVLGEAPYREYVTQECLLGTGHALATALASLEEVPARRIYFLCGDKPLLSPRSLRQIGAELDGSGAAMAFLVGDIGDDAPASRQGRVLQIHPQTPRAEVLAIVERPTIDALNGEVLRFQERAGEWHAYRREELLAVREANLSAYVWPEAVLRAQLGKLQPHPEKGEYFVTDLVALLRRERLLVRAVRACVEGEGLGIDTPAQAFAAERAWRRQTAETARPAGIGAIGSVGEGG
jgi:bifunctional UDP-N-acetylglucosamine pyrophosphorylase/glucosamine-1-phosphate N-acetyltransferase